MRNLLQVLESRHLLASGAVVLDEVEILAFVYENTQCEPNEAFFAPLKCSDVQIKETYFSSGRIRSCVYPIAQGVSASEAESNDIHPDDNCEDLSGEIATEGLEEGVILLYVGDLGITSVKQSISINTYAMALRCTSDGEGEDCMVVNGKIL